jgi:cytochrome P450
MTMNPDIARRMSWEQINRAFDNIARELDALLADQLVLVNERDRRMSAVRPKRLEGGQSDDAVEGRACAFAHAGNDCLP